MSNWTEDLIGSDESDDNDDSASSLFADNFARLVEDGEVENLNEETIRDQIDKIDDVDVLQEAIEADDRDDLVMLYTDRIETLEADDEESAEPSEDDEEEEDLGVPELRENVMSGTIEDTEWVREAIDETTDGALLADAFSLAGDDLREYIEQRFAELDVPNDEFPEPMRPEDREEPADGDDAEHSDDTDKDDEAQQETPDDEDQTDDSEPVDQSQTEGPEADEPDGSDEPEPDVSEEEGGLEPLDVQSIAPGAVGREQASEREKSRTMLVWGEEGTGKTHVAHSAPKPLAYIDTEGKADELADKFDGPIHYFFPDDFAESLDVLDQAFDVLDEYYEEYGVRGTIVVDSMTVMWEWAQLHHMQKTRPAAESLADVHWESAFGEGQGDWQSIKAYHNREFRDPILNSPYNAVFTAGRKEKYNVNEGETTTITSLWKPDCEKHNAYNVKEVVNLKVDGEGRTVGELHKAAKTRYSFLGLVWPEWDDIYEAIDQVYEAEQSPGQIDITSWSFDVVDGKPQYVVEDNQDD